MLEIGCGWGALAARLAQGGALVTGVTLSSEQLAYATQRSVDEGLAKAVSLELTDYRDVEGSYDRIVSIEMLEAVGEAYWPVYFKTLRDRLKAGGTAVLQVITIDESRFDSYRSSADFIQRYVFPGRHAADEADHRRAGRGRRAEAGLDGKLWPKLCQNPGRVAGEVSWPPGRRSRRWDSRRVSAGCGNIISAIARQVSGQEPSMSAFLSWRR